MQTVRVCNATKGTVLGERVAVAETSVRRMIGLLGKSGLDAGTGLLINPSQAVHTFGMRFPIDVVFVDKKHRVVSVSRRCVLIGSAVCIGGHDMFSSCRRMRFERAVLLEGMSSRSRHRVTDGY